MIECVDVDYEVGHVKYGEDKNNVEQES